MDSSITCQIVCVFQHSREDGKEKRQEDGKHNKSYGCCLLLGCWGGGFFPFTSCKHLNIKSHSSLDGLVGNQRKQCLFRYILPCSNAHRNKKNAKLPSDLWCLHLCIWSIDLWKSILNKSYLLHLRYCVYGVSVHVLQVFVWDYSA